MKDGSRVQGFKSSREEKTAAIRRECFRKGGYPAATGVVIHSLLRPDWLIEIDFLAVVD